MGKALFSPLFVVGVSLAFAARGVAPRCLLVALGLSFLTFPALVAASLSPWGFDARYNACRVFFKMIEVGMSHDEVIAVLNSCYPEGGPRLRPRIGYDTAESVCFFMNAEGPGGPNCEAVILELEHGKVRSKRYSAD